MRLLFLHDRFGAMAGAEVNLFLTARELKRRGHAVGMLHGAPTGRDEPEWRALFSDRFPLDSSSSGAGAADALRIFQPDAVYVHKMDDPRVFQALLDSGRPVVRMVHDHDLYCLRSYKYFPLTRNVCRRAAGPYCVFPCGAVLTRSRAGFPVRWQSYRAKQNEIRMNRRFHRMIVASEYMKGELLRNGFDPRRIEIHAPVPLSSPAPERSPSAAPGQIIYAGQIIRGKGVDVLLEALAKVRSPFHCLIFGDGHHRPRVEALSRRLALGDRVTFKGYLSPGDLAPFYAGASIAVVSSVWPEPFGAVGLEAMRHGLPVVAFDAGGIKEWLVDGYNGYLVPWMDRAQFAARIEQLINDPALARKLGEQGRLRAGEKFGFDNYITNLEKMFLNVIDEVRFRYEPQYAKTELSFTAEGAFQDGA